MTAGGLIPLSLFWAVPQHAWVSLRNPAEDLARYGATVGAINQIVRLSASAVFAIVLVRLLWFIGQAGVGAYRKRAEAAR